MPRTVLLSHDSVQGYLAALDEHAPGMDLRIDYAIAMGFRVIHAAEAGRLDRYRELAARTFDRDEHDSLVAAALAWLLPLVLAGARTEEDEAAKA